jgi:hypothetical protein
LAGAGAVVVFLGFMYFLVVSLFLGMFFVVLGLVVVFIGASMGQNPREPTRSTQPVSKEKIIKEQITRKEGIVKIRCSHCGTLFDETLDKCPNCGAKG